MDTVAPPFINTTFQELTPIPIHGQNGANKLRRVYFEKTDPSDSGIFYYDQQIPGGAFQRVSDLGAPEPVRPHATYSNIPLFPMQTVAVTWEDLLFDDPGSTTDYLRVVLQPGD